MGKVRNFAPLAVMRRDRKDKHCFYCGTLENGYKLHIDHLVPKSKGGTDSKANLVYACNVCNSIKGTKLLADARQRLILNRIGWPRFTEEQLDWLRKRGFDTNPVDTAKLYFEERQ